MDDGPEGKRKWPRMPIRLDLSLRLGPEDVDSVIGRTLNVSREGLFVIMDPPRPLGTEVRMQIEDAQTGERFQLEGVVVHTVPDLDDSEGVGRREPKGIGVFLTSASAGWVGFCMRLAHANAPVGPPSLGNLEIEAEFDEAAPTERDITLVPKREDDP